MGVKLKTNKYKKKYKCSRCHFTSNDKDIVKRHRARNHGDFGARERILKAKYPEKFKEVASEDKIASGEMKVSDCAIPITYRYDDNQHNYRIYTDATKYGNDIELVYNKKTQKFTLKDYYHLKLRWEKENASRIA